MALKKVLILSVLVILAVLGGNKNTTAENNSTAGTDNKNEFIPDRVIHVTAQITGKLIIR